MTAARAGVLELSPGGFTYQNAERFYNFHGPLSPGLFVFNVTVLVGPERATQLGDPRLRAFRHGLAECIAGGDSELERAVRSDLNRARFLAQLEVASVSVDADRGCELFIQGIPNPGVQEVASLAMRLGAVVFQRNIR